MYDFQNLQDVINKTNGGEVIFATDDFFAVAENLIKSEEPEWREGLYTQYGKWMDGWETRRKRKAGHDFCILKMAAPAFLYGVDVNTEHFTGNHAPCISIQASKHLDNVLKTLIRNSEMGTAASDSDLLAASSSQDWQNILETTTLSPGYPGTCHNLLPITSEEPWQYLRLNLFPDGGVARLRVYGKVKPPEQMLEEEIELSAFANGGECIAFSNAHFGHPRNLIGCTRGLSMADGWETARRLDRPRILQELQNGSLNYEGSEWCILKLGVPGKITKIKVDTSHFKGNYPDTITIDSTNDPSDESSWQTIVTQKKLDADKEHIYFVTSATAFHYIRVTIIPDGGISRIRVYGFPSLH